MPAHTYSYSRLETFKSCARQFKIQYIDKIPAKTESIEAYMGSRVHEALEKLYRDVQMTKLPVRDEIVACYDRIWTEKWHDGIKVVKKEYSADNYREVGRRCVAEYYDRHHPFDETRTLALEHLVFFPLDEDQHYWLRGFVDRVAVTDGGTYQIHDYKTSGRLKTQGQIDHDQQLALYQIAVQRDWRDAESVELVWHYLVFGKELRSVRSPKDLEDLKRETLGLIKSIEAESDFRPRESALCDWCAYQEYCPAKKHLVMTAGLTRNEYLDEPGVRLVNRYAELDRQRGELDLETQKVKAALIEYARKHDVEIVKGDDHRVMVRFYKGLSFPTKDDPGRKALEELVRASGLWERVSVMSPVSLAKLVERGELDQALARKLAAMGKEEVRPWVKLSGPGM
jgi:putative RecB family exonuclease